MAAGNQMDARDTGKATPSAVTSRGEQNPPFLRSKATNITAGGFAADVRHKARRVMDGTVGKGNRMILILATVILMTVAMGVYLVSVGVYMGGSLLFGSVLWLDIATYALMGVLALTVVLPLAASVFRLACLMTCSVATGANGLSEGVSAVSALSQIVYPFTSRAAYRRCMAVGMETLGWILLWAGLPAAGFGVLASLFDQMANRGVLAGLCDLMTALSLFVCVGIGVLLLLLSGRRAGFGYLVFVHEDISLREVNRRFKGLGRSFVRPFVLRLSLTGWVALSIVAVLVPFVVHTVPYGLCCGAVYGYMLHDEC